MLGRGHGPRGPQPGPPAAHDRRHRRRRQPRGRPQHPRRAQGRPGRRGRPHLDAARRPSAGRLSLTAATAAALPRAPDRKDNEPLFSKFRALQERGPRIRRHKRFSQRVSLYAN
ncbi:hypothetical protein FOCC_FOCC011834 [Frankliniella occidentalis]|nr:hypothetical protein FOCC_FOCC011834 [Frankliniella occidentalis]